MKKTTTPRRPRTPRPPRTDRRERPPGQDPNPLRQLATSGAALLLNLAMRAMKDHGIELPTYSAKCRLCRLVIQSDVPRDRVFCPNCGRELRANIEPVKPPAKGVDVTFERMGSQPFTGLVYPAKGGHK